MTEIPEDVMKEARKVVAQFPYSTTSDPLENRATIIAAALLAAEGRGAEKERERCAIRMQPIEVAADGNIRFRQNAIVNWLWESGKVSLNEILAVASDRSMPIEDIEQFWQMLGYSVSGFGDLSFVRPETVEAADKIAAAIRQS
jgi:hypothetical protein